MPILRPFLLILLAMLAACGKPAPKAPAAPDKPNTTAVAGRPATKPVFAESAQVAALIDPAKLATLGLRGANPTFAKPEVLTPAYPIAAFERAIPLLLDILPGQSGSCCLIREIVWSLFNKRPVGLSRVCTLDQDRKDALLAVINLRMALGGDSDNYIRNLLVDAGVFDQHI